MPELPEVETVKEKLKKSLLNKRIIDVKVYYDKIIANLSSLEFIKTLTNQTIKDITRKGKWIIFELDSNYLLSHLRMEGKYFIKDVTLEPIKHEHISFIFNDFSLRYMDTRKFGRMYLLPKDDILNKKPLNELGLEPWDKNLNEEYLKIKFKNKTLPIKSLLLDQSIITGIGNIYADEILFLSRINPTRKAQKLTDIELETIISNTKKVLESAISLGGTTIRTYESSEGVHGNFQQELFVHTKDSCKICGTKIEKIRVGGRGTYYCPKCQKE